MNVTYIEEVDYAEWEERSSVRRFRISVLIAGIVFFLLSILVSRQVYSYVQPATAEGRYILLRLEDVGPGGFYGTPEGVGKLKAVLEYLKQQNVPYHITVVSRWKTYLEQGGWLEAGIDIPTPLTKLFVQVLREAQSQGAILGMHGYSHQYGNNPRADGHHNSGFGNEFKVKGEPVSESPQYAEERIEKSLRAFEQNGLKPAFWESPHYNSTTEQQRVFRSYMGLIYEPNKLHLRSLRDIVYIEEENAWKGNSQGAVYIPAPLRYIYNQERVQQILDRLKEYDGLASMYYHPYLEFSYLEPVTVNGQPVSRDGLPVFQYKQGEDSPLRKLVEGIKQTRYEFGTIHDVVPFSPAHRVKVSSNLQENELLTGDVNGDGREDWVGVDSNLGQVFVTLSNLEWPRNRKTLEPVSWVQHVSLQEGGISLLVDTDGDNRKDLLRIRENKILLFKNEGSRFNSNPEVISISEELKLLLDNKQSRHVKWLSYYQKSINRTIILAIDLEKNKGLTFELLNDSLVQRESFLVPSSIVTDPRIQPFLADTDADAICDLILFDSVKKQVWVMKGEGYNFKQAELWYSLSHGDRFAAADFNGDGKSDLLIYNKMEGIWQVLHSTGSHFKKMPASFGPWARIEEGLPLTGDWDGNGKADIAMYNPYLGIVDAALSFQD